MSKPPKSFFNYRVILSKDKNGHPFYSIRGVHYGNYGKKIESWDAEPLTMTFDQGDSITEYLHSLEKAATLPVLMVEDNKLVDIGERPAEMFVGSWKKFPACITSTN